MRHTQAQRSANELRHDAGYLASIFRQLAPDLITILEFGAIDMLEADFREVDQEYSDARHDGDHLHCWQAQNDLIELTRRTLRCSEDQARRLVLQHICFPRLRARCNKVRKLAADLRQQEAAK